MSDRSWIDLKVESSTAVCRQFFLYCMLGLGLTAKTAIAAPELTPVNDQLLQTGQLFSMVISANGAEDDKSLLTAEELPDDAVLLDNLDGSSTFMWIPESEDVGDHMLVIRLADTADPEFTQKQSIKLTIATDSEYQRLQQEQLQSARRQRPQNSADSYAHLPAESEVTAAAPPADQDAGSGTSQPLAVVPEEPTITLEDKFTLETGAYFEYTFKLITDPAEAYQVRVLNRPKGLQLNNNDDSTYTLHWMPSQRDMGTTRLIVQVIEADTKDIVFSDRLRMFVKHPRKQRGHQPR